MKTFELHIRERERESNILNSLSLAKAYSTRDAPIKLARAADSVAQNTPTVRNAACTLITYSIVQYNTVQYSIVQYRVYYSTNIQYTIHNTSIDSLVNSCNYLTEIHIHK